MDAVRHVMECQACEAEFDPLPTRWRCPECGWRVSLTMSERLFGLRLTDSPRRAKTPVAGE